MQGRVPYEKCLALKSSHIKAADKYVTGEPYMVLPCNKTKQKTSLQVLRILEGIRRR